MTTDLVLAVQKIQAIEAALRDTVLEREEAIRIALVALLCRQHCAFIGPVGAAKSKLIREIARYLGLAYYEHPGMSSYTTPEELFGTIDLNRFKAGEYARNTYRKLPEAQVAFLDEAFKAHAVLNVLLSILNERLFLNGNDELEVPLLSAYLASNELPQGDGLEALWDRITFRYFIEYLSPDGFRDLIALNANGGSAPAAIPPLTPAELLVLQQAADALPIPPSVQDAICKLREDLAAAGIQASDRRFVWALNAIRANALLEGAAVVEEDHLVILEHVLWNTPDQRKLIAKRVSSLANPLNAKMLELKDEARGVYKNLVDTQKTAKAADFNNALVQSIQQLKKLAAEANTLVAQATAEQRPLTKLRKAAEDINTCQRSALELLTAGR